MADEIELGPTRSTGRPFTDPSHTRREEEALRLLLAHERERARAWCDEPSESRRDVIIRETDAPGSGICWSCPRRTRSSRPATS